MSNAFVQSVSQRSLRHDLTLLIVCTTLQRWGRVHDDWLIDRRRIRMCCRKVITGRTRLLRHAISCIYSLFRCKSLHITSEDVFIHCTVQCTLHDVCESTQCAHFIEHEWNWTKRQSRPDDSHKFSLHYMYITTWCIHFLVIEVVTKSQVRHGDLPAEREGKIFVSFHKSPDKFSSLLQGPSRRRLPLPAQYCTPVVHWLT